jgi:hypothetical protein
MRHPFFSPLLKIFLFLVLIAAPHAARAADPMKLGDFNNQAFNWSSEAVKKQLAKVGEPDARCDDMAFEVNKAVFRCLREKAKCEVATLADGGPGVSCAGNMNDCQVVAYYTAEDFWALNGTCKEMKVNVFKPGCGNMITEFGEDCDMGAENGTANATCNDQCKLPGTASVPGTASGLCGNKTVDPGEECDSGSENGKRESDCDVQCRKFSSAAAGTAPIAAQPQAENNAVAGSCALHADRDPSRSVWSLLR